MQKARKGRDLHAQEVSRDDDLRFPPKQDDQAPRLCWGWNDQQLVLYRHLYDWSQRVVMRILLQLTLDLRNPMSCFLGVDFSRFLLLCDLIKEMFKEGF